MCLLDFECIYVYLKIGKLIDILFVVIEFVELELGYDDGIGWVLLIVCM